MYLVHFATSIVCQGLRFFFYQFIPSSAKSSKLVQEVVQIFVLREVLGMWIDFI